MILNLLLKISEEEVYIMAKKTNNEKKNNETKAQNEKTPGYGDKKLEGEDRPST